jgi:hemerythrin-like domain-containing protein
MDALQLLREDHRKVKELFRQFEEADNKATKRAIAETCFVELDIHSVIEEEVFYPAVRRQGNGTGEIVGRAEEEHHLVDNLMAELMEMEPGNMEFDAKFHILIENVKTHIDEEEAQMLPLAAEVGMARLEKLGERMEKRRAELLTEGQRGRRRARTRAPARSTGGARSAAGTKTSASTRSRSSSGTRSRSRTSGTRSRSTSGTRPKASGTRSRSASTAGSPSSSPRTKTAGRATAQRSASRATGRNGAKAPARSRTVAQAGTRKRTTQTRSKISGGRSGSQSGR